MTIAKQLILVLVKEISAEKKQKHIIPEYPLWNEINSRIKTALDTLVSEGTLIERPASVNRYPAYQLPKPQNQTT